MYALKTIFILQILFVVFKNEVLCCKTISFNEIDISVHYQHRNWRNLKVSDCISPTTTVLENGNTGAVQRIKVNNQTIPILKQDVLASFSEVFAIELQNNKITAIKKRAFNNLPQLKYLYLSQNKLRDLEHEIFFNLPKLEFIFLQENQLTFFEQEWFGVVPKLEILYLSHNFIETISENSFTKLSTLTGIHLGHNRIAHIHGKAFEGLYKLFFLDLSYNLISQLPDNLFTLHISPNILNLYNNNLTYINEDMLDNMSNLKELIIFYNPMTCACQSKLLAWAKKKGVQTSNEELICKKTTAITKLSVCVQPDDNICLNNNNEDLYNILHSEQSDFQCHRRLGFLETLATNCCP